MKRLTDFLREIRNLILLGILTIVFVFLFATLRPGLQPAGEPYPAPLESGYPAPEATMTYSAVLDEFLLTRTEESKGDVPTPCIGAIVRSTEEAPPELSIATPLPIAKTVDLAEGLSDVEKKVFIIQRSDGTYEKYIIPLSESEKKNKLLDLGPNDRIIRSYGFYPPSSSIPPISPDQFEETPFVISNKIDKAGDIPDELKVVYMVERADGTYDQIILPSGCLEDMIDLIGLETGDRIINWEYLVP